MYHVSCKKFLYFNPRGDLEKIVRSFKPPKYSYNYISHTSQLAQIFLEKL